MSKHYNLTVSEVRKETPDTVSVEFETPQGHESAFRYTSGQYLNFRLTLNGQEYRRSYSLCSSPHTDSRMRVAVKIVENGVVSSFFNHQLKAGDIIVAEPPAGNFFTELDPANKKHYVAFAAGSGITPVYSIIKSTLSVEPQSTFTLIFANRSSEYAIFGEEIRKLAGENPRFRLIEVWSRENTTNPLLHGRLNPERIRKIIKEFDLRNGNEFFICGPEEIIINISDVLKEIGIAKDNIHFELFTTPVLMSSEPQTVEAEDSFNGEAEVKIIIDGIETSFNLPGDGLNVLDAAIEAGADAPFSCKGAVCCTCKGKIIEGKAIMNMNYALTDKEVADGYILTCQAHPRSSRLVIDYDVP